MRHTPLRLAAPPDRSGEPGFRAWHEPAWGECGLCGVRGRLVRHHVIAEQHLRAIGAPCWNLRNALELGLHCACHRKHHSAAARIPASQLPARAIAYAIELLGPEVADAYIDRYYADA